MNYSVKGILWETLKSILLKSLSCISRKKIFTPSLKHFPKSKVANFWTLTRFAFHVKVASKLFSNSFLLFSTVF